MAAIKPANVLYIASKALKQARQVVVDEDNADGVESALLREGGTDGDPQHLLDQALLDYKQEASKSVLSTEDGSAKMLARRKETRNEKAARLARRKREYEKVKKDKVETKKRRLGELRAAERHHLTAQTVTKNAVSASVTIAAKQCEHFRSFLALYAQKNNLRLPPTSTEIPSFSSTAPLHIDPHLLVTPSNDTAPPTDNRRIRRTSEARLSQRTQMKNQTDDMPRSARFATASKLDVLPSPGSQNQREL